MVIQPSRNYNVLFGMADINITKVVIRFYNMKLIISFRKEMMVTTSCKILKWKMTYEESKVLQLGNTSKQAS